jgi:hypothetical protein
MLYREIIAVIVTEFFVWWEMQILAVIQLALCVRACVCVFL